MESQVKVCFPPCTHGKSARACAVRCFLATCGCKFGEWQHVPFTAVAEREAICHYMKERALEKRHNKEVSHRLGWLLEPMSHIIEAQCGKLHHTTDHLHTICIMPHTDIGPCMATGGGCMEGTFFQDRLPPHGRQGQKVCWRC